jgi:beta-glucosidase
LLDRYGTYSTTEALNAGLDLEMPGPPRWRTQSLVSHVLSAGKVSFDTINERAGSVLSLVQHLARTNPEVVYGDGEEGTLDTPERRQFCREIAAEGIVLLKNENGLLPLKPAPGKNMKVVVVGPNAKGTVISGGGSAALKPSYVITPFAGIGQMAPEGVEVSYALGCYAHKYTPTIEKLIRTHDGQPGWTCTFYGYDAETEERLPEPVASFVLTDTRVKVNDFVPAGLGSTWGFELRAKMTPDTTGPCELGLTVAGRARLYINGEESIDNWTHQRPGDFFYGQGTMEETAVINVEEGVELDIRVSYINTPKKQTEEEAESKAETNPALMRGLVRVQPYHVSLILLMCGVQRLGGCPKIDSDEAIAEAVTLAKASDIVIFVGGLTNEWEAEGTDRPSLALPGRQADTIRALGEANKNTVVVIQAGSAVDMTWAKDVGAILHSWYLGNEVGAAISDVLYGRVNPAGKLPLSLPARIEDSPTHLCSRSENGQIHYREDLFVGYKHYHAHGTQPLFPFGYSMLPETRRCMTDICLGLAFRIPPSSYQTSSSPPCQRMSQ